MRVFLLPWAMLAMAGLTSCTTYTQQNQGRQKIVQGNDEAAAQDYSAKAKSAKGGKDAIIWRLEQGATLRIIGKFQESNQAFDEAEADIDRYEQQAKLKIGHQAGALLSNQAELPYVGRSYDKIMLDTYKALNELSMGNVDRARVDLTRSNQREQDAVAENAARIEKAQSAMADQKENDRKMAEKAQDDSKVKAALSSNYGNLDGLAAYGDYVNPFSVYLDGLVYMATEADGSDLERARKSLERSVEFSGGNPFVRQDLQTVGDLIAGKPLTPTTYIIFENGLAPIRNQIRIDVPIFLPGNKVPYAGAAFPVLALQSGQLPNLGVSSGGATVSTAPICSMDSVIARDFKNDLPTIITKTIASTVVKAAATYAINSATDQQSSLAGLFSRVVTGVGAAAVNIADTRTWTTLPKEFQICRVPTPTDRHLSIASPLGSPPSEVTVIDGTINVVYVRSALQNSPLRISQFKLK
jgi:hypothetical protein